MAATTTLLGLVTPTQGTLTGTWGDTVNYGISDYVDISVAGTLTLTNDGAVTLANTTGSSSGNNITSTLTGAGTVTAQFAIVKVTGTLTVAKVVTGPSYSKTYTVVNSATGGIVTFKASGQTGVSVAVGETAFVYFNGTDYVKIVGTATAGAAGGSTTQVQFNSSGVLAGSANMTFNGTILTAAGFSGPLNGTVGATTATTGAFTTLTTSSTVTLNGGTANGVTYLNGSKVLTSGSALTFDGTNLGIGTSSPVEKLQVSGLTFLYNEGSSTARLLFRNTTTGSSAGGLDVQQIGVDASINNSSNGYMSFSTNNTEAGRFDANGRLLLNCTSPVGSSYTTIQYSADAFNGFALNQSTNSSGGRFMLFASQGTQCGVIDRVGSTSAVVYTSTSDARLKENIVDSPSAIAHINAVKVRSFNWIEGGHQVKYGVIAQEFIDVEPDAVVQGDTGQTVEKTWSVDTSALVPAMIKAMQEQQVLITQLQADVAALKA